ncbi:phosphoribosylaminoimidazolesuccinocarboxamide synthase [Calditrichota bacterium GD2]
MSVLTNLITPQLKKIHSGKVRESFRVDDEHRLIVATDRISAFDSVLKTAIPGKGAVLNSLAAFWFEKTQDIVPNHFVRLIDPNISLVREAKPIKVEMIVRGYLTGSAWRGYQKGKREVSGVPIPEGMKKNQPFPEPIVTPTTKEESDREISAEDLVKEGWVDAATYQKMAEISLKLFKRGSEFLAERGIILVDTKYEFGLVDGQLVLIDEIHTPDSSRFWSKEDYENHPENAEQLDKEYVRSYLLQNKKDGRYPAELPPEVVAETTRRYREIFRMITGSELPDTEEDVRQRVYKNLLKAGLIKPGFVVFVMGSPSDEAHARKMQKEVEKYGVFSELRVVSAHKNGERIPQVVEDYNLSIEPGVVVAIAGRSNGLGGALAANLTIPVINCPPFADKTDLMVNVNSSLMMPSNTPAATVIDPKNAAQFAVRCLNLPALREQIMNEIQQMKKDLIDADRKLRGR